MRGALIVCLLLAACEDKPAAPAEDPAHPKMKPSEQDRALELCTRYVDRLCACAEKDPSLKDPCDLARSQPEAVRLDLSLLHGVVYQPDAGEKHVRLNDNERRVTEAALRKVVAACVEADARLDPGKCPRP